jgi:hypothetical protein
MVGTCSAEDMGNTFTILIRNPQDKGVGIATCYGLDD